MAKRDKLNFKESIFEGRSLEKRIMMACVLLSSAAIAFSSGHVLSEAIGKLSFG